MWAAFGPGTKWNPAQSRRDNQGTRVAFSAGATEYSYMTVAQFGGAPYVFGPFTRGRDERNAFSFAQLKPVPEPETYALMLLGLAGVGALRRRQA